MEARNCVERISIVSSKPFEDVISAFESALGHPDMSTFPKQMQSAQTYEDLKQVMERAAGKSGLIAFARFDLGVILQKELGATRKSRRYLVGNPLVMKDMLRHVPDAGSYAPRVDSDRRAGRWRASFL